MATTQDTTQAAAELITLVDMLETATGTDWLPHDVTLPTLAGMIADRARAVCNGRQKGEPPTPPELIESAEDMLTRTIDGLDYESMDQAEANRVTDAIMAAESAIARR